MIQPGGKRADLVSPPAGDPESDQEILELYKQVLASGLQDEGEGLLLNRRLHAEYLYGGLGKLPAGFSSLDASRTWICYWIVHALSLLEQPLPASPSREAIIAFLASCQDPRGGFGGGPFQLPHLATTYAAVCTLVTLGGHSALEVVDRDALYDFAMRMCVPPSDGGGMRMHEGGEVDVRGCYCALAAFHMLGLDKAALAQACGLVGYVQACQSYEGGVGGEPGNEAHGGYAFCGFAALALVGEVGVVDGGEVLHWATRMQGRVEGGFRGRTSKLVDACYSFWAGGIFPLLEELRPPQWHAAGAEGSPGSAPPVQEDARMAAVAARVAADLTADAKTAAFMERLMPQPPVQVAQDVVEELQRELEAGEEICRQMDEAATSKPLLGDRRELHARRNMRKQECEAVGLEVAAVEGVLKDARWHLELVSHSAPVLLQHYQGWAAPSAHGQAYDPAAAQLWLLACCQGAWGGLRDKPGKSPDYYHTCYGLSGLSSSQHGSGVVVGGPRNLLAKADPLCNVVVDKLAAARQHFESGQQRI